MNSYILYILITIAIIYIYIYFDISAVSLITKLYKFNISESSKSVYQDYLDYKTDNLQKLYEKNISIERENCKKLEEYAKNLEDRLKQIDEYKHILPENWLIGFVIINIIVLVLIVSVYYIENYFKSTFIGKWLYPSLKTNTYQEKVEIIVSKLTESKKEIENFINKTESKLQLIEPIKLNFADLKKESSELNLKMLDTQKYMKIWKNWELKKNTYIDYITIKNKIIISQLFYKYKISQVNELSELALAQLCYLEKSEQITYKEKDIYEKTQQQNIGNALQALQKKIDESYNDFKRRIDMNSSESELPFIFINKKQIEEHENMMLELEESRDMSFF